jgi:hypothetical protein
LTTDEDIKYLIKIVKRQQRQLDLLFDALTSFMKEESNEFTKTSKCNNLFLNLIEGKEEQE